MGKTDEIEKINVGDDEQMSIRGYTSSYLRLALGWLGVAATGGLLLIAMSWRKSILMMLTHKRCSLEEAEKVLLVDCYEQQFVENVIRPGDRSLASKQCVYFYNKRVKYIWDPQHSRFKRIVGLNVDNCSNFHGLSQGINTTEAVFRLQFYGKNSIEIAVEPVLKLVLREIRSPFYIYQIFIVIVWLIQVYYQFALCIVLLSTLSITATVWETRKQSRALKKAVRTDAVVTVIRDGKEVQKSSEDLVPGDVIVIPQSQFTMVCDAVLISGNCVVNESMLTGESTPITKVPITDDPNSQYDTITHKRSTIFCGTEVLHSRNIDGPGVRAVVFRTGFATAKGELVRAILFPKPINFKLYQDLFKCMIFFFFLGIPAVVYSSLTWVHLNAYPTDVAIIVLDVLTFLVPPVLPAVLTSINAHAQRRLRKLGIYCLNSRYINFCGGLDVVCFDKTGTLTEDSLDLSGAIPAENGRFERAIKDLHILPEGHFVAALATCHSLTKVGGKLLGHTLDVKIFEALGWELEEPMYGDEVPFEKMPPRIVFPKYTEFPEQTSPAVAVVRQFPFESLLRRMSVVAKIQGSHHFDVYLKGAPELVSSLSRSETVPENFKDILEFYTRQGFRVLGLAHKALPEYVQWEEVLRIPREELECDLNFKGLIVLQNRLKPETIPTLNILKDAAIRTVMVTGDNLLTAITVSRECGMIEEYDSVVSVEAALVGGNDSSPSRLQVNYNYAKLPGFSEKLNMVQNGMIDEICVPTVCDGRYHIAMEGSSFNLIRLHDAQLLNKVVLKGTIFARMLPEHKLYLIETLQDLGYQVGMCGDGANDCGALKTAHAGVSLSVAEASVASPFTSTQQNIKCIPTVIREGRATLAATFGAFRYMVTYCFVLLSAVLILFWDGQKPTDGGYVMIDVVLNLLPPIIFGSTHAFPGLVRRPPTRSIVSFVPLFSMFSFIIIQIGVYILAHEYCLMQPWYEPFHFNRSHVHAPEPSHAGTTILTVNMMSYVIAAVIFAPGPPYRKNFLSNKLYMGFVFAEFVLVTYLTVYPDKYMSKFINFKKAPFVEYHLVLYIISLANFIVSYIWEVFFVQGILFEYVVPALRRCKGPIHKYEKLEQILLQDGKWPPVGRYEVANIKGFSGTFDGDEADIGITRHRSGKRFDWARRSSELRHSLMVGLKLAKSCGPPEELEQRSMSFVTFKEGQNRVRTEATDGNREFL